MSKITASKDLYSILDLPLKHSFRRKTADQKWAMLSSINIFINLPNPQATDFLLNDDENLRYLINNLKNAGYAPISDRYILHAFVYVYQKYGLKIPYNNQYKRNQDLKDNPTLRRSIAKERAALFAFIASKLEMHVLDGTVRVIEKDNNSIIDITEQIVLHAEEHTNTIEELADYDSFNRRIVGMLDHFVLSHKGLLVFISNRRFDYSNPFICIETDKPGKNRLERGCDKVCQAKRGPSLIVVKEVISYCRIKAQQELLKEGLNIGNIKVVPAFNKNEWPKYGLMNLIRSQVEKQVGDYLHKHKITCDPLDVQYQVLFRLTSFNIADIFEEGEIVKKYYEDVGIFSDWHNIFNLNEEVYGSFRLSKNLVNNIIEEQITIIQDRLSKSQLPIKSIVNRTGLFAEDGWEIKKSDGRILVVKKNSLGKIEEEIGVYFKLISNDLANMFHRDLHYIHTPRSNIAFGLFLNDEELPFSVLAIEKVDRPYKQNTLLLYGYDPRRCIEFTRLYSRPGVPHNTSSAMFGEAFAYIKRNYPEIEAAISAFMPSYATGLSMLTGGFMIPILMKPTIHYFRDVYLMNKVVKEQVAKRRQRNGENLLESTFPLLPTVELISPLKQPRFTPILTLGKQMLSMME